MSLSLEVIQEMWQKSTNYGIIFETEIIYD